MGSARRPRHKRRSALQLLTVSEICRRGFHGLRGWRAFKRPLTRAIRVIREIRGEKFQRPSKAEAQTPVYDAAVERSPFVHGPLPVEASLRPQEAIVFGLPHVREVLCIHKNAKRAKASFNKHAK